MSVYCITQGPQAFGNKKLFSGFKIIPMFWWNLTPVDTGAAKTYDSSCSKVASHQVVFGQNWPLFDIVIEWP